LGLSFKNPKGVEPTVLDVLKGINNGVALFLEPLKQYLIGS